MVRRVRITAQHSQSGVTYRVRFGDVVLNNTERTVRQMLVTGNKFSNKQIVGTLKSRLDVAIRNWR